METKRKWIERYYDVLFWLEDKAEWLPTKLNQERKRVGDVLYPPQDINKF